MRRVSQVSIVVANNRVRRAYQTVDHGRSERDRRINYRCTELLSFGKSTTFNRNFGASWRTCCVLYRELLVTGPTLVAIPTWKQFSRSEISLHHSNRSVYHRDEESQERPSPNSNFSPFNGPNGLVRSTGRTQRLNLFSFGMEHAIPTDSRHPCVNLLLEHTHKNPCNQGV